MIAFPLGADYTSGMSHVIRVAAPPGKPLMLYDGECDFCLRWIGRWQRMTGEKVDYLPARDASVPAQFPEIPPDHFDTAVQLIETDGRVYSGAEAVLRAMAHAPHRHRQWPLRAYEFSPILARTAEAAYRLVANHRSFFARLTF